MKPTDLIRKISRDCKTISFIGLEKGSGKTAAFKAFISALSGPRLGVTSIGSDHLADKAEESGELVYIPEGTLLATAHKTLALSDITREVLHTTGIQTPLGEIVLLKALSEGNVFLAGPSVIEDVVQVRELLFRFGAETVLIDGAVDRKSSAAPHLADGVVLTAKLFSSGFDTAEEKLNHQMELMRTSVLQGAELKALCRQAAESNKAFVLIDEDNQLYFSEEKNTKAELLRQVESLDRKFRAVVLNGAVTGLTLRQLTKANPKIRKNLGDLIVVPDATRLFLKPQDVRTLAGSGLALRVLDPIRILALCINTNHSGLDSSQIEKKMQTFSRRFNLPVLDVQGGMICEQL